MSPMRVVLDFPRPPSSNVIWRHKRLQGGKLAVYRNPEYREWLKQFGLEWLRQKPKGYRTIQRDFETVIITGKQRADLDNIVKPILDAAQQVGIIANDKYNKKITVEIGEVWGCRLIIEEC